MNILALDIGSSSVKAAVLDVATAQPVGPIERAACAADAPTPDAAEVPVDRLWAALTQAARAAIVSTHVSRQSIAAVGLSTMTPALVLLDASDAPIGPIWTHLDRRTRPEAREVWNDVGKEFLGTIGNRPLPGSISALSWRRRLADDPRLPERVRSYLHLNGWLALHMTGGKFFDRANACFTGLFGTLTDQQWSSRWCNYFHVDPAWLPPVVCGSTTAGTLRPGVADELGLSAGIPVKLGTADTSSALLAAGIGPGDLLHVVGTTQLLVTPTTRPKPSPRRLTRMLGVGDTFLHLTHNPVGGVALDWLRHLCFREQNDREFYERTIPQAILRETLVRLDPPFLAGDRLDFDAKRASFCDLELATDRLDLLSALLDAMVDGHDAAVKALAQGPVFQRVFLTGAGADFVRMLIPDYQTGTIEMLEEGSLRGVAKLFTHDLV